MTRRGSRLQSATEARPPAAGRAVECGVRGGEPEFQYRALSVRGAVLKPSMSNNETKSADCQLSRAQGAVFPATAKSARRSAARSQDAAARAAVYCRRAIFPRRARRGHCGRIVFAYRLPVSPRGLSGGRRKRAPKIRARPHGIRISDARQRPACLRPPSAIRRTGSARA